MFPVSHVLASFVVLLGVNAAVGLPVTGTVLLASAVFAVVPDVDAFFFSIRDHHRSPLHAPLFWLGLGIVLSLLPLSPVWTVLLPVQAVMHIVFDFVTGRCGGIPVFYPFSMEEYGLPPEKPAWFGDYALKDLDWDTVRSHLNTYLSDPGFVLFELGLAVSGAAALAALL